MKDIQGRACFIKKELMEKRPRNLSWDSNSLQIRVKVIIYLHNFKVVG